VIAYVDTSVLVKLLVDDEPGRHRAERVWLASRAVVCAEVGYVEARAALAAAGRAGRLRGKRLTVAKTALESLWRQMTVVVVDASLIRHAGELAEEEALRGYDAVHLAAAITGGVAVVATADHDLAVAALRRGLAIAGPQ
jgi:predicted nucleic acid-binding protein